MSGIDISMSEAALAALFTLLGTLLRSIFSGRSKPTFDKEPMAKSECFIHTKKNDEQHAEFYRRIARLETGAEVQKEMLSTINRNLEKIMNKLGI